MLQIDAAVCLYWALLFLTLPLPWLLAAGAAALVHELCHLMTALLLKARIQEIRVNFTGVQIDAFFHGALPEAVSSLAGPIGSFLLLFLFPWAPRLAVCGFVQGAYNLLPVYPLDGGRFLRCMTERFCPDLSARLCLGAEIGCALLLLVLLIEAPEESCEPNYGWLLISALIMLRIKRKTPCKRKRIGVQ